MQIDIPPHEISSICSSFVCTTGHEVSVAQAHKALPTWSKYREAPLTGFRPSRSAPCVTHNTPTEPATGINMEARLRYVGNICSSMSPAKENTASTPESGTALIKIVASTIGTTLDEPHDTLGLLCVLSCVCSRSRAVSLARFLHACIHHEPSSHSDLPCALLSHSVPGQSSKARRAQGQTQGGEGAPGDKLH